MKTRTQPRATLLALATLLAALAPSLRAADGVTDAEIKIGMCNALTGNSAALGAGLAALKQASPQAVIMVGSCKACAAFIKKARAEGFKPAFCNVSFVGNFGSNNQDFGTMDAAYREKYRGFEQQLTSLGMTFKF
jgi:ABC-type branched-subunit amino acid transport system substrate-binding protein